MFVASGSWFVGDVPKGGPPAMVLYTSYMTGDV